MQIHAEQADTRGETQIQIENMLVTQKRTAHSHTRAHTHLHVGLDAMIATPNDPGEHGSATPPRQNDPAAQGNCATGSAPAVGNE